MDQPTVSFLNVAVGWLGAALLITPAVIGPGLYLRWVWRRTGRRWAVACGVLCVPPLVFLVTGSIGALLVAVTGETTVGRGFWQGGAWGVAFSFAGLVLSVLVSAAWCWVHPTSFSRLMRPVRR